MKHIYTLIITVSCVLLSSCSKDVDNSTVLDDPSTDPPYITATSIAGYVYDAKGKRSDYSLLVGGQSERILDPQEVFYMACEDINKKGQPIYVTKDGEILSMMHTPLIEYDINYLKIAVFPAYRTIDIDSESMLDQGIRLQWDKNKLLTSDGELVMKYRSLKDFKSVAQIGTSGYSKTGRLQKIIHRHAFEIRIADTQGTPKVFKDRDVTLSIDKDAIGRYLYRYDDKDQRWKFVYTLAYGSENLAIEHAGMYSVIDASPAVYAEGRLVNTDKGISYQELQRPYGGDIQSTFTTVNGRFIDVVEVESKATYTPVTLCGTQRQKIDIHVASGYTKDLVLRDDDPRYREVQPIVYDCDGSVLSVNALSLANNKSIVPFTLDNRHIQTYVCDDELQVTSYDLMSNATGDSIHVHGDSENLYIIKCDTYDENYGFVKVRDDLKEVPSFAIEERDGRIILTSDDRTTQFSFENKGIGSYAGKDINVYVKDPDMGASGYFTSCLTSTLGCGIEKWVVTHFPEDGNGLIRIEFSGTLWMQTIAPAVAGNYAIEGVVLSRKE